jgi:hypothetical protein
MTDVFISHSSQDKKLALWVAQAFRAIGLEVFLSSDSIGPGQPWSSKIREKLKESTSVVFLATRSSIQSDFVKQETGIALEKELIPMLIDVGPDQLPGWVKERQALDIRGSDLQQFGNTLKSVGLAMKKNKDNAALGIAVGFSLALLLIVALCAE